MFSGHGGQCDGKDALEKDKKNECIFDCNLQPIIDNEIKASIIDNITVKGVRIYFHFDSCHSGTAVDLPYNYIIKENRSLMIKTIGFKSSMWNVFEDEKREVSSITVDVEYKPGVPFPADAFLLSGCKDIQTSSDAFFEVKRGIYLSRSVE